MEKARFKVTYTIHLEGTTEFELDQEGYTPEGVVNEADDLYMDMSFDRHEVLSHDTELVPLNDAARAIMPQSWSS